MFSEFSSSPYWDMAGWACSSFHLILLCADGFALWIWKRHPSARSLLLLAGAWLPTMAVLGLILGIQPFLIMRLWCYGLFLHLPVLLLVATALLARSHRHLAVVTLVGAIIIGAVAVDAFWIEPEWLEVTERTITGENLSRPIRIVVIADLQTDYFGEYQRKMLQACMRSQPDLILFAGDYVQLHDGDKWPDLRQQINDYFREVELSAPLGVYAVAGNTDRPDWQAIFEGLPITCVPKTDTLDLGPIHLTALSMRDSFDRDLVIPRPSVTTTDKDKDQDQLSDRDPARGVQHAGPEAEVKFHIVLGHAPDFARSQSVAADLLVAGHTHGGQVQLPGIGPLMTASSVPRAWAVGLSRLDDQRQLLVSRGIGMERGYAPRLRFLCRPELAIVDLVPATSQAAPGLAKSRQVESSTPKAIE